MDNSVDRGESSLGESGYFGIGVENLKTERNLGTLFRSAYNFGASFIFVIGKRYQRQASDTTASYRHIPFYQYETKQEFLDNRPYDCLLVGVEIDEKAVSLPKFTHPKRCIYLLGPEDGGLSIKCNQLVSIPTNRCLNVSVAGSIVMYDRIAKRNLGGMNEYR